MPQPPTEEWERVQELFAAAVELPPEERTAFLDRECGDDETLRREVQSLLDSDEQAQSFIEGPAARLAPELLGEAEPDASIAGRHFGPYEVVREIGRGGLGAVYLAVRWDGEYRKEVALKLIRRGLDTDDILRRFRNERQILAQLEHPNIARLIDGGTTDDGLPYFVMEYINGEPISTYCEKNGLATRERLELFRKVCGAVTYAHQNLVIHRDLKPSNIVVTADGEPKLLDFGIAKLLTAESELFTQTAPALRAMTPEYASPEQIKGERITTASDVYSLGVLLYELLTGRRPYRLKTRTPEEIARAITDQEPERPSTAVAANPDARVESRGLLDADLDNIVLMAMRKEPHRRYPSAAALAEDIRRHEEGLPITARANTFSYRAGKFISRHRAGALAAALVMLAIVVGMAATLWQAGVARAEKARAEKRFNDVRKLANSYLFDVYPKIENLEGSLEAREAILTNALAYLDSLANEAQGDSELQSELATAYEKVGDVQGGLGMSSLGNSKAALASYAKAEKLRAAVLKQSPEDLEAKDRLANNYYITGRALWNNGQSAEAELEFEKALKLRRELVSADPDEVKFRNRLAILLIDYAAIPVFNYQAEKALALCNEAAEIVRKLRRDDPENVDFMKTHARGLRVMSKAYTARGDFAQGLAALEETLAISKDLAARFPQDFRVQRGIWLTETLICELQIDRQDGPQAVASCVNTVAFPAAVFEKEPENGHVAWDLAISHFNNARAYRLAGQPEQTIPHAEKAIDVMSALSKTAPGNIEYKRNVAIYQTSRARAYLALGRFDEALADLEQVRQALPPLIAADQSNTTYQLDLAVASRLAAQALHQKGENAKAVELVNEAAAIFQRLKDLKSLSASDTNVLAELEQEKSTYLASAARAQDPGASAKADEQVAGTSR